MSTNKKGVMHVYKLDTGNHQPSTPPSTTTKKIIIRSLGSLLRRSKTYRETNHNHINNNIINNNLTKEDTKEVVLETSRKSLPAVVDGGRRPVPAVKDGRKSASVVEEGKKGKVGIEVGVVAGRRSAENRAEMVMINVGEVADLYQVKVLVTDMPAFMQVHAFRCARRTFDSLDKSSPRQIAFNMKKDFDKVYGPAWHCIVGSNFGSFVTHATGCFLYFTMEDLYVLVFKTKVRKDVKNSH